MEFLFAYIAGLLTLINPCVLPVLPIVLSAGIQSNRHAPLYIAAGMSLSFVVLGILVATFGRSLGLTESTLANTGALLMIFFGLVLLVPKLNGFFSSLTTRFSSGADGTLNKLDQTKSTSFFLGGILLGAVWSPCIGPTLGGAISLASQGEQLSFAFAIMLFFAFGVSTVIIVLGYGTREAIKQRQHQLKWLAERAKPIMGITFILIGLMIYFKIHHVIEGWLIDVLPIWIQDLSVKF